jgi:putative hydrolase of the HAD superfamily
MRVRAVLFDLGHTLWDVRYDDALAPAIYRNVRRRLARAKVGPLPSAERLREAIIKRWAEEEIDVMQNKRLDQRPAADIIAEGLATLGITVSQRVLDAITDDILSPDVWGRYLEPDTLDTLGALKERDLKLGVVSNTYQRGQVLREQLAETGALPYIDVAVFSSEVGLRKPHPSLFEAPLAELGVAPQEAVFVGDSLAADIRGAQAVGMLAVLTHQYRQEPVEDVSPDRTVWAQTGPSSAPGPQPASAENIIPDHIIRRLPEVIEYVDRLNSRIAEGQA